MRNDDAKAFKVMLYATFILATILIVSKAI